MTDERPEVAPQKVEPKTGHEDRRQKGSHLLRDRGPDGAWARYIEGTGMGMTKGDCATFAVIGEATVRLWRQNADEDLRDEVEDSVFLEFFAAVGQARTKLLSKNLATIEVAREDGDWKAASWLLERLGYHKKTELDIEAKVATLTYTIDLQDEGA